jgi:hypothetical protein
MKTPVINAIKIKPCKSMIPAPEEYVCKRKYIKQVKNINADNKFGRK